MYNPDLGTFDQRDPIGYEGGMDLYEYCGDDPLTNIDPSGMDTCAMSIDDFHQEMKRQREEQDRQFRAAAQKLRQQLYSCCKAGGGCESDCIKESDSIMSGLTKAYQIIYDRGGPSYLCYNGPVCSECELQVLMQLQNRSPNSFFDYGTVTHVGPTGVPFTDHVWGEITCKATGQVFTIDFWKGGTDFWRCGPDAYGWKRNKCPPIPTSPPAPPSDPGEGWGPKNY
ncbi:MAG: RHS repeat-associated core domain-containing protein [Thermoguttaceae bacterium]|jgi:hypothetical protein